MGVHKYSMAPLFFGDIKGRCDYNHGHFNSIVPLAAWNMTG